VLTTEEKRFIKYWEEQRTGGKFKYYLLYILAGTFIATLVLSFLYSIIISALFRIDFGLIAIIVIAFLLVTFLTITTWDKNEKKFKRIIKREIQEGQRQDDKLNDEKLI
jgi:tryptophan-rich sensory protein